MSESEEGKPVNVTKRNVNITLHYLICVSRQVCNGNNNDDNNSQ